MIDLTKETILENANKMKMAEASLKQAIAAIEETCEWLETSFAGQNEIDWVNNMKIKKPALNDTYDLTKKQAEKLQQIAELFDPEV